MIEINLLPREFRKKPISLSFGKSGLYAVAAVVGVLVMLVVITVYQMHQLATFETNIGKAGQRAAMLKKDIEMVDALMDVKEKIGRRMAAVEQLDSHRSTWVRILENLSQNVPEFVWLGHINEKAPAAPVSQPDEQSARQMDDLSVQKSDTAVTANPWVRQAEIEGYAFTLNALASFMINMMRSDYFDEVELVSTNEVKFQDQKTYTFVLSCALHYLSDEELRGLIAQGNDRSDSEQLSTDEQDLN